MAKDFKVPLKLTVDGEADLKKAMSDCSSAMKGLNSEAKLAKAQFEGEETSLKALAKQQEIAAEKAKIQEEKVKALSKAYEEELAKSQGKATDESNKLAVQLNNANADLIKAKKASEEASDEYKKHASVTGQLKDKYGEVKDSVNALKEAHPKATKAIEATGDAAKAIAKGGLTVLKASAAGAVTAVGALATGAVALGKSLYESASAASEYGDSIDKGSQKMGVTNKQYQELAYYADLSGTSMTTLQKATVKLQQAGSDLDIEQAINQLSAITDADERAAAAQEMFGEKIANELAPMLNSGTQGLKDAKQAANDYGLVMSDSAVKASAAFNDTKTTMVDTVTMLKNNLSAELLPGINDIMGGITGLFTGDESAMQTIEDGIDTLFEDLTGDGGVLDKITNLFNKIMPKITEKAPEIIKKLVEGLTSSVSELGKAALDIIDTLVNSLFTEENISTLTNGAVKLLTQLVTFLSKNAGTLVGAAATLITTLMDSFLEGDNLQTLIHGAIDMVGEITLALIDHAPDLIAGALEMAKEIVKALKDYDWISLAKEIYQSIKSSIVSFFSGKDKDDNESHAGGLGYVPYNGYVAELHQGERILTAAEVREGSTADYATLNAKVDALITAQNKQQNVNINVSGSAGAIVRALNIEIEKENRRASAFA